MTVRRFEVENPPHIELRVSSGRLHVAGGDEGVVEVEVTGRDADRIVVEHLGDTIAIVEPHDTRILRRGSSVVIRVKCPNDSDLSVAAASLDIDVSQQLNRVMIRTASGDARLHEVGSLEFKSASGDVDVRECAGDTQINSASGDVRIERAGGEVQASLASGDLWVGTLEGTAEVRTASGDVRVDRCLGNSIAISSMSGDLVVGIPGGQRVEAEISTLSGDLSMPERAPVSQEPKKTVRLRLKTVSGDIRVNRL